MDAARDEENMTIALQQVPLACVLARPKRLINEANQFCQSDNDFLDLQGRKLNAH